jgi:hypothetical protein
VCAFVVDVLYHVGAAPSGNDLFSAATTISGASGSVSGTTLGKTSEVAEADFNTYATAEVLDGSAWYKWTATASGFTQFTVDGGDAAFSVLVFADGTSLATLDLASLDYPFDTGAVATTAGSRYIVRVVGPRAEAPSGPFTLTWSPLVPEGTPS